MQTFSIGTENHAEDIIRRLEGDFRFLAEEGVDLEVGRSSRGKFTFLDCRIPPEGTDRAAVVRHYLAGALTDVLVDQCASERMRRVIRANYYYFSKEEQERILGFAHRQVHCTGTDQRHQVSRKTRILHRIRDYLDQSSEMVLEGFLNFRLQDLVSELEDAVDRAVDEFLMEREQSEFIRLLRFFVEVQEPRTAEVHVLLQPSGAFKLVDGEGTALASELLAEFVGEVVDQTDVSSDDLLISALITIAPRRIAVHGPWPTGWHDTEKTMLGVFVDRVELCAGCHRCQGEMPGIGH